MQRKKASEFRPRVLELFDGYVHGKMGKRQFLDHAAKYTLGGVGAAALLESLQPDYALAQQVAPDDPDISIETSSTTLLRGTVSCAGFWFGPRPSRGRCPRCW
jgi:carboxymethylenebutenolidase